jgi:hypothetical protein
MRRQIVFCALVLLLFPTLGRARPETDAESPALTNVPELTTGFRLLYEQKFQDGRNKFTAWASQNPEDPFGPVAIASSYLFEEFFRQGVLTSEFFLDDNKFLKGIQGKPNAERMKLFLDALNHGREMAKERLKKRPKDPEALFALTLAAGMESNADSILLKKQLDALKRMKEANEHAKELLAERPDAYDAWVGPVRRTILSAACRLAFE